MRRRLYSLGEVPVSGTDPVLAQTRAAADVLLAGMQKQSPSQGLSWLLAGLKSFDPKLPGTVMKVADTLRSRGMALKPAVREALARGIADSSIDKIQAMGRAAQAGAPVSGLGQTTTTTTTTASSDPGQVLLNTLKGLVCAPSTATAINNLVAQQNNASATTATTLGIAAGQGAAQCNVAATAVTPAVPVPTPVDTTSSVLGGFGIAVAVLSGVALLGYFAIRHRPRAAAAAA